MVCAITSGSRGSASTPPGNAELRPAAECRCPQWRHAWAPCVQGGSSAAGHEHAARVRSLAGSCAMQAGAQVCSSASSRAAAVASRSRVLQQWHRARRMHGTHLQGPAQESARVRRRQECRSPGCGGWSLLWRWLCRRGGARAWKGRCLGGKWRQLRSRCFLGRQMRWCWALRDLGPTSRASCTMHAAQALRWSQHTASVPREAQDWGRTGGP